MKSIIFSLLILTGAFTTNSSFAQDAVKTETIKVWGNCGMCEETIEKSAKKAGATDAAWNEETKVLTVSYNSSKSSSLKIQQSIAAAGYDTQDVKATDKAYNKLHGCCKYERKTDASVNGATKLLLGSKQHTCSGKQDCSQHTSGKDCCGKDCTKEACSKGCCN
jgi:periplasmic mercuric ion binding protein